MQTNKNTQHYYLQTMGITPWVLREASEDPPPTCHGLSAASMGPADKPRGVDSLGNSQCIILLSNQVELNQEERILFNHMLESIGLDSEHISIKLFSEQACKAHPAALKLPHPSLLLQDPIQKRNAYAALGRFLCSKRI